MNNKKIHIVVIILILQLRLYGQIDKSRIWLEKKHCLEFTVTYNQVNYSRETGSVVLYNDYTTGIKGNYLLNFKIKENYGLVTGVGFELYPTSFGYSFEKGAYGNPYNTINFPVQKPIIINLPLKFVFQKNFHSNTFFLDFGIELLKAPRYETKYIELYGVDYDTLLTVDYKYRYKIFVGAISSLGYKRIFRNNNALKFGVNIRFTPFDFLKANYVFFPDNKYPIASGLIKSNANYIGFSIGYEFIIQRNGKTIEIHY